MSDDMDLDALLDDIENGNAAAQEKAKVEVPPPAATKVPPAAMAKATASPGVLPDRPQSFISMDKFRDDVVFKIQDMQSAFVDQSALYVHYAHAKAQAHFQAKRYKQRLELLESKMDTAIRKKAVNDGEKLTEGAIKNRITASMGYQEAKDNLLEAEHIHEMLSEVVESFRHRRDMLIQAGADVRAEKQGGLRLNDQTAITKQNVLDARQKTA